MLDAAMPKATISEAGRKDLVPEIIKENPAVPIVMQTALLIEILPQ